MTGEPRWVEGASRVGGVRRPPSPREPARPARLWFLVLLLGWGVVLGIVPTVRADGPTVSATLSESVTTVGEPVELRIVVTGGSALGRVQPPEVDGLTIRLRDSSQTHQFGLFDIIEVNSYLFLVSPQRAGIFTLPETEIQVGTRRLRTRPLTLTVTAAAAGGGGGSNGVGAAQIRAELLLPKRTAYVGEALPAEFRMLFGSRVELLEPSESLLLPGEGFAVGRWTQPQTSNLRNNGGGGQRTTYKAIITAARAGTLTLGPGETTPTVRAASARARSNDPFYDDPFGGLLGQVFSPPRDIKVRAEPVTLEVRPLPTAGQPADFTGGVGRFDLGAMEIVSPARGMTARAGEPVVVRLTVRGQGSFDRLGAPLPDTTDGLRFYEPKDRFKADDNVGLSGAKTFEQTFIPAGPRDHVPGFHLSYFDPVTGSYQSLRTPPVPLKILPGTVAPAASPTPVATIPAVPPAAGPTTPPAEEILRPLRPEPGPAVAADVLRPAYARRSFWLAQCVPLAGLVALLTLLRARARRRDAAVQRRAARARERERLWRIVRDPHAGRRAFLDAAVRLLDDDAGPPVPDDVDQESLRARHAELAYGGGGPDVDGETVPAGERAEVLTLLRGKNARVNPARSAPLLPSS